MKRIFLPAVCLIFLFNACRTPKDVSYFQGIESLSPELKEAMNQKYTPRICIDDNLIIYVTSPDRKTVAPFVTPPYGFYTPGEDQIGISATTQNLFTYLVDEFGEINFPILGRIKVVGMTVNETTRMLEARIRESAPDAIVSVQIANFMVGIFGEVRTPNRYPIKTPRISVLDLIAMAGDLTIVGDRKNVWLHRDNNGEKVQVRLDLTDPAIFASPYYYLQQNDMVYVQPNKAQMKNSEYNNRDNTKLTMVSIIVSSVSIVVSALLTLRGQNR
jgi:polysaccharide export outer membrane protein